tara:strand:- start:42 stop:152 length:111 start_codon:yes stop_codon:yes gene_type:complete
MANIFDDLLDEHLYIQVPRGKWLLDAEVLKKILQVS